MPQKAQTSAKILNIKLSSTPREDLLSKILSSLKTGKQLFITTPNPEIIVLAQKNPSLRSALAQADLALPDGIGLILAARLLKLPRLYRYPGREAMLDLLELANEYKLKVFFLGAQPSVNQAVLTKARREYPNLKLQGTSGPKLDKQARPITLSNNKKQIDTINKINLFKPDILFIAFGAPKQELWLAEHLPNLKVKVALTVGGSFDFYVGAQRPVPAILSRLGLEWLWRLANNPKRIKRILRATITFPYLVFKDTLRTR